MKKTWLILSGTVLLIVGAGALVAVRSDVGPFHASSDPLPSGQSEALGDSSILRPPLTNRVRLEGDATPENRLKPRPASTAEAQDKPILTEKDQPYFIYQAQEGDTAYGIAERFGISPEYLLANNRDLLASEALVLGQTVIVPTVDGILHEVQYGETLADIAARYGVAVDEIVNFAPNHLADTNSLLETQVLFVPDAQIPSDVGVGADRSIEGFLPHVPSPPFAVVADSKQNTEEDCFVFKCEAAGYRAYAARSIEYSWTPDITFEDIVGYYVTNLQSYGWRLVEVRNDYYGTYQLTWAPSEVLSDVAPLSPRAARRELVLQLGVWDCGTCPADGLAYEEGPGASLAGRRLYRTPTFQLAYVEWLRPAGETP